MDKKEEEPAAAAKPINVRLAAFAHFLTRVCPSRFLSTFRTDGVASEPAGHVCAQRVT